MNFTEQYIIVADLKKSGFHLEKSNMARLRLIKQGKDENLEIMIFTKQYPVCVQIRKNNQLLDVRLLDTFEECKAFLERVVFYF